METERDLRERPLGELFARLERLDERLGGAKDVIRDGLSNVKAAAGESARRARAAGRNPTDT